MAKIKKSEQYNRVIQLMLQDISTEEIAKITQYSIHNIRKIYNELREEYGVNSKSGIAIAYLREQINKLAFIVNAEISDTKENIKIDISIKNRQHGKSNLKNNKNNKK